MRYSLSFQGGGAKVVQLVAAADAMSQLIIVNPDDEIVRVSGTSAGSIAAALYATGCDFGGIVANSETIDKAIKRHFPNIGKQKLRSLRKIFTGKPLIKESAVKSVLKTLFKLGGVDASQQITTLMGHTRSRCEQLRILYSSLTSVETQIHDENSTIRLIDALVDSCAIPFVFRTANSDSPEKIDGGLFQNLPGKYATDGLDGAIIPMAIVFEESTFGSVNDMSPVSYAGFIIDRIISERTKDAAQYFQSENIIQVETDAKSLDFLNMFSGKFQVEYKDDYDILYKKFRQKLEGANVLPEPDYHSKSAPDMIFRLSKIEQQAAEFSKEVVGQYSAKSLKLCVTGQSLLSSNAADIVSMELELDGVRNEGRQFFQLHFYDSSEGALRSPKIVAYVVKDDGSRTDLNVLAIPVRQIYHRARPILVCLERPLCEDETLFLSKTEKSYGVLKNYKNHKADYWQSCIFSPNRVVDELIIEHRFPDGFKPKNCSHATIDDQDPDVVISETEQVTYLVPEGVMVSQEKNIGMILVKARFTNICKKAEKQVAGIKYSL